ncbi:MAG: hypothetical protein KAS18_02015 [Calditrichia bacterium]|nr:hypothetical protein [Calditrichia bacterium]
MNKQNMKIVGNRKANPSPSWQDANRWLKTIARLRGKRGICKKGVYLFKTFDEAHEWKIDMLVKSSLETPR